MIDLVAVNVQYFEAKGQKTDETFAAAKARAEALDIKDIVVASTSGATGVKACDFFKGFNLVVVRHATGFKTPGEQEMLQENEKKIVGNAKLVTSSHAFASVDRGVKNKFGSVGWSELIAQTLRIFGEGTKVAVEIVIMAADAGAIPVSRDVISIAGTSLKGKYGGADTAIVVRPAHSVKIFDIVVREYIAKPREIEHL